MAQNISARRGATIAGFAALVLLILVAAFDNQWTAHWREGRSAEGGDTAHSWISSPVRGLSALAWRATKEAGEPSRLFYGTLAAPVIAVVLTFLVLLLVCRGVGAERGRWSLFLGSWFVTGLAAAVALIVGASIAGIGDAQAKRGDVYYSLISLGLAFGLFAGWLVGFVAVLVYGSTEVAEEDRTTQEYPASPLDDYSFSPTSPYSGSSESSVTPGYSGYSGYSGYESANAPTEVNTPTPPEEEENNPYGGGARPY
ncbi:hypothetical protein Caci_7652 [Catenulispora acidiphila DSM 44928]|uniref:Uncharacterized protein n=1 Tax=Catenulispora acidiphila (strain DSM 44928 / JCM 14897 / NBRC 102108 / NRRL B-24433 / ID139908) TaxID=479433 RepID=C7QCL3_CATAD|nr:hypothetical protein [Catenulispora acidiphila]ACU76476.1 hypothetical protein Caci_7652 [Catenulispora acidiphila DSM 44928]